jgi:hypothetical protein
MDDYIGLTIFTSHAKCNHIAKSAMGVIYGIFLSADDAKSDPFSLENYFNVKVCGTSSKMLINFGKKKLCGWLRAREMC